MLYTKGYFTKELKKMGVRQGDTSDGRTVKLEHLKYADLVNLYFSVTAAAASDSQ